MCDGFGSRLFPLDDGRFLLCQGFEGASDGLFGGMVAAGAEVSGDELFAVGVEGHGEGHASGYYGVDKHNVQSTSRNFSRAARRGKLHLDRLAVQKPFRLPGAPRPPDYGRPRWAIPNCSSTGIGTAPNTNSAAP